MAMTIEITGLNETIAKMDELLTSNPRMAKQVKKIIGYVLTEAKKRMRDDAKTVVGSGFSHSSGDKRQAYRAIKSMVYRRIFGGNLNIISRRKRTSFAASIPEQKKHTGRGGNRMNRSANTIRMMSYWGEDRSFVLRWISEGTNNRSSRFGNRGSINGNGWFSSFSERELKQASQEMADLIDRAVNEIWENKE